MLSKQLFFAGLLCIALTVLAQNSDPSPLSPYPDLPPLETFVLEPMEFEHLAIWIPADKTGPTINRSCTTRTHCQYSCALPGTVEHSKSAPCPAPQARLLAELAAPLHQGRLPLTIFNGWQWEYRYSLSQFKASTYDLRHGGGSWENCLEAVLHQTNGTASSQWMRIDSNGNMQNDRVCDWQSQIDVTTYSEIRTRHGYPKVRILEQ